MLAAIRADLRMFFTGSDARLSMWPRGEGKIRSNEWVLSHSTNSARSDAGIGTVLVFRFFVDDARPLSALLETTRPEWVRDSRRSAKDSPIRSPASNRTRQIR